jgi:hypothetical protein
VKRELPENIIEEKVNHALENRIKEDKNHEKTNENTV